MQFYSESDHRYCGKEYLFRSQNEMPVGTVLVKFRSKNGFRYTNPAVITKLVNQSDVCVKNGEFFNKDIPIKEVVCEQIILAASPKQNDSPFNLMSPDEFKVVQEANKFVTNTLENIKTNNKKEKKSMNILSGLNLEFGKVDNANIAYSIKGVAINGKCYSNGEITDVAGLTIDSIPLFKIPVALKDVAVGDMICHNGNFVHVKRLNSDGTISAVDVNAASEITALPVKNMFGFNYVTKIVNPMGNIFGEVSESNPFGSILPLMLLQDGEGDNKDMMTMMLMSNMMGGSMGGQMNPLMMMMLMGNKDKGDNSMLMAMAMSGMIGQPANTTAHTCSCGGNCYHDKDTVETVETVTE